MATNKTVLISLIGKGKTEEGKKGYSVAKYFFEGIEEPITTSFFGSALYKVLISKEHDIDKWLIFGTDRSSWSELLYAIDEQYHNELIELYDKVYDEENVGISEKLLLEWQNKLQKYIPGIYFIMVDPLDYKVYIDHMIKEIPNEEMKLVLDITHGFRHMPAIMAFSIMMLKHVKNITDIMVYYGAFELGEKRGHAPVLKIDFINTLVSYAESLATYNYSGYFPPLLELLGIPGTERTYYWLEMNRQPRTYLEDINKSLSKISLKDDYQSAIAEYIKKDFNSLIGATLDRRMVERSKFFFDKKQYLKALILLYEGIIIAIGRVHKNITSLEYNVREEIRKFINNNKNLVFKSILEKDTYCDLKDTRNSAAHGSEPKDPKRILKYVQEEEEFKALFKKGIQLYERIVGESVPASSI